jgi:hypothetical protein
MVRFIPVRPAAENHDERNGVTHAVARSDPTQLRRTAGASTNADDVVVTGPVYPSVRSIWASSRSRDVASPAIPNDRGVGNTNDRASAGSGSWRPEPATPDHDSSEHERSGAARRPRRRSPGIRTTSLTTIVAARFVWSRISPKPTDSTRRRSPARRRWCLHLDLESTEPSLGNVTSDRPRCVIWVPAYGESGDRRTGIVLVM